MADRYTSAGARSVGRGRCDYVTGRGAREGGDEPTVERGNEIYNFKNSLILNLRP